MSEQINVQRAVLAEIDKVLNQGTNNFLASYLYQETKDTFIEESQDPNNFWVINRVPYVPTSYQWVEGSVVALPTIYDESGLINIQWALYVDADIISKLDDVDSFKRALRGLQGKIYADDKKSSLGTNLGSVSSIQDPADPSTLAVGTYIKITGELGNLDRIYEVKLSKSEQGPLPEEHIWFNTYKTLQEYEYENLVLSLNSASYNIDSQPYIMNSKRISIVTMQIPYRVHDGKNGSENSFRIKPLTVDTDSRGNDDYIDLVHITRQNGLGIETSGNQSLFNPDAGILPTMNLFGSTFLVYDQENFLIDYLYNRTGRYMLDKEVGVIEDTNTTNPISKIFTIEINIGRRTYFRDVVIDSIGYIDGHAERNMWSITFKQAKELAIEKQKG